MNILLTLSYDGSNYCGWQRQKNGLSIQECLETALSKLYRKDLSVIGASRTDAGVHAYGQRALFSLPDNEEIHIPIHKLPLVINSALPEDIIVTEAFFVPEDFNPRFAAKNKTYEYNIYNATYNHPFLKRLAWFVPGPLHLSAMEAACALFVGTHDFSGFCAAGGSAKTSVRTIYSASLQQSSCLGSPLISFTVNGNGFLYNMVRIIVGTLVYVGQGKLSLDEVRDVLEHGDRKKAGKTAPPQGLTLMKVYYEPFLEI